MSGQLIARFLLLGLPAAALAAPAPQPRPAPRQRGEDVLAKGRTVIPGTWSWQVEGNRIEATRADLFWQQVSATERNLVPQGGAGWAIVQGRPFEKITLADLKKAEYSTGKLPGSSLRPGTVVALRTRGGKLARLKVVGYRALHDTSFPEARHLSPAWVRFAQGQPNTQEYHLEVDWVLYKAGK
jgi:hypothetical protein